ncbi:MAG: hypothetical protein ABEJ05_06505 [Haloglomus sp.]
MTATSDREAELRELAADVAEDSAVADAWLAKSFTDRVLVVTVESGAELPDAVRERLAEHDLRGANEVYESGGPDPSAMGDAGAGERHRFVDTRTRGEYQSYVVE